MGTKREGTAERPHPGCLVAANLRCWTFFEVRGGRGLGESSPVKRMARAGKAPGHFRFGRRYFYASELDCWMRMELHSVLPLPRVPVESVALTTGGGLVLVLPQFENTWSHCSP